MNGNVLDGLWSLIKHPSCSWNLLACQEWSLSDEFHSLLRSCNGINMKLRWPFRDRLISLTRKGMKEYATMLRRRRKRHWESIRIFFLQLAVPCYHHVQQTTPCSVHHPHPIWIPAASLPPIPRTIRHGGGGAPSPIYAPRPKALSSSLVPKVSPLPIYSHSQR